MNNMFLGIDIAKEKVDVALLSCHKWNARTFKNSPKGHKELFVWLSKKEALDCHACMEATGVYGEKLAFFLHEKQVKISVVNPACVKGFGMAELKRTKTDAADAKMIASFCKAMQPEKWTPPAAHVRQLQARVRRLDALTSMCQEEKNRLEIAHEDVRSDIKKSITFLEGRIKNIKNEISDHIKKHKDSQEKKKLLETIPGVGDVTIQCILAFLGEHERFGSAKQVAAFAGLSPKQCQSGSSLHGRTRLSKTGDPRLRKALFLPAMVARQHNPVLCDFADRLEKAGKNKMVIIGTVMRKLVQMIYGVLKHKQPFNPKIHLESA